MRKVLGIVFAILFAAVLVVLILASTQPATFHVERTTTIASTPEHITPWIADFHRWNAWSPWAKLDPHMQTAFSGPPSGSGAVYTWEGNSKVGKGRMEVLSSTPVHTSFKLDFLSPFEGHNVSDFHLVPDGSGTKVTWSMDGPNTFMGKVMSVFTTMDGFIGKDFDNGLANLKAVAER